MNEIKRIAWLRREINRHNHLYYVLNTPQISDKEFDDMLHELERLEHEHPELDDPLSPTHRVGSDLTSGFEQVAHIWPMLSLSNTYSIEEIDEFFNRVRTSLMGEEFTIIGEMK